MDKTKNVLSQGEGRLAAVAPLANPYVPFQMENPPKYEARFGLVRGTLFPGLDLPFQGKVNEKELPQNPMNDMQALAFAIQELALYLDTHKEDEKALELYREYQEIYARCRDAYTAECGPINHMQVNRGKGYEWLADPWPWEYSRNQEV